MKKSTLKFLIILQLFLTLVLPASAAMGIPDHLIPDGTPLKELNKSLNIGAKTQGGTQAAISGANRVLQFIANGLLYVAAPLAILFIAHAGQNYGFAFGDQTKLEAAKKQLTYALLGLGAIIFSYIIVRLIIGAVLATPSETTNSLPPPPPAATSTENGIENSDKSPEAAA